jgi:4-alpha-glucanotransferase
MRQLDYNELDRWVKANLHWLEDWALFSVLKEGFEGRPWTEWPSRIREREPEAIAEIKEDLVDQMSGWMREQFVFQADWDSLRYCSEKYGVELFGDLPFFLAHDSADVWANQHLFLLEESGAPAVVAGVPPDYFSKEGQRWGTVHYNWDAHRAEGFAWWKSRMTRMFELFDIVRIDHFRAIDSAWAIPAHHPTAEHGEWVRGPGDELLEAILEVSPKGGLVAEDLGIIPDSVVEMRKRHGLPGMAVLQFTNDDSGNPHNPENHTADMVVYTGTHDNDTSVGWGKKPVKEMITTALESPAELAIIPLQDVMRLGSDARMNTPGIQEGNWEWKFDWEDLDDAQLLWFGQQVYGSGRRR